MNKKLQVLIDDIPKFKHFWGSRIEFSHVDSFGVVHNLTYPYFIEWARTDYLFNIGMPLNNDTFTKENPLMTVHSTIDYFNPLRFTDTFNVLTRLSSVGDSSIKFENLIIKGTKDDIIKKNIENHIIAHSSSILVYVDAVSKVKIRIPESLRSQIFDFENGDCEFRD